MNASNIALNCNGTEIVGCSLLFLCY
jgi:hypothetical protein